MRLAGESCAYAKSWLLLTFGAPFVALASFSTNPPPALPLTSSSPGSVRVGEAICKRRDAAASAVATQRTTIASSARIFLDPSIRFLASASRRALSVELQRCKRAERNGQRRFPRRGHQCGAGRALARPWSGDRGGAEHHAEDLVAWRLDVRAGRRVRLWQRTGISRQVRAGEGESLKM